jgi:enamine deaminase RidA (YjgF/YER057c/UK114 family)
MVRGRRIKKSTTGHFQKRNNGMSSITRIGTNKRLSRVVIHNDLVWLSGMTASDRSEDIRGQCRQLFEKIDGYLKEAGTDKSRILSAQVWLQEIDRDFAAMNEEWEAWLPENAAPARAAMQVRLISKECLVEIVLTAAL